MNNRLFSIIIPTRERPDTLKFTIQSVLNQTSGNFEIVIADNCSTPETESVVRSFGDNRIKYQRSDISLSMADNWEAGLSRSSGEFIFILGDDDALMPDALEVANTLIDTYNFKIISWLRFFYAWDSSIVPWLQNRLGVNLQQFAEIKNSRHTLQEFYQGKFSYEQLPMAYNSFIHRDVINKVKSIHGRYFDTHCPDSFSGIANAYFTDQYLYSYRALSITGTSGYSNGAAQLYPGLNNKDLNLPRPNQDRDIGNRYHSIILPTTAIKIPVTPETAVADVQLKTKEIFFPEDRNLELDIKTYIHSFSLNINRDPSIYEEIKDYIEALATKYNLDLPMIPKKTAIQNGSSFQGIVADANGRSNHLRINCSQAGVFNVADAAKLALAVLPHYSQLQICESPNLRFYNSNIQPKIAIDGVFFQLYSTGIARVWKSLLEEWANTEFGKYLVVLDRVGTAPKVEGISYYQIPAYDYNNTDADRAMLQQVCTDLGAELFISTYYTTPLETPSVFMGYDMIPEVLGADLNQPMWQEKQRAIEHASAYLTISTHTAKDLVEVYPAINPDTVTVAHCGTQSIFITRSAESIDVFRNKYGITKPYFILIGSSLDGYKNGILFWQAFSQLDNAGEFDIICTGAAGSNAEGLKQYAPNSNIHHLKLDDNELNLAYAGATGLVYPSKYEGFGLPIVEAFASGCPVITCPNASIPEVAAEAAIYVFDDDIDGMAEALCEVQKPQVRAALIAAGLEQVKQFSWTKMGDIVKSVLIKQTLTHLQLGDDNLIIFPDWSQDEDELGEEIANICHNLAQNSEFNRPTLLIDTSNVEDLESVNLLVSSISMNLMMSADIDITEHLEIALTGKLAPIQWQALLPKLHGRIKLELEDVLVVESSGASLISEIKLTEAPALALV